MQSTVLAVMAALGDIKKPDLIIHADTTWERDGSTDEPIYVHNKCIPLKNLLMYEQHNLFDDETSLCESGYCFT